MSGTGDRRRRFERCELPARRLLGAAAIAAASVAFATASANAAPLSSGVDRGSRITLAGTSNGVAATAAHGDTLYLGGDIPGIGLRSPGLAVVDAADGSLRREFPELDGTATALGDATKVVPDAGGGAWVLGIRRGADGVRQTGLMHVEADGDVDTTFRPRFRDPNGAATTVNVRDATLSADGRTLYVAGSFAEVNGQPRDGVAALDPVTGAPLPWAPDVSGADDTPARLDRIALAGSQLLISGTFATIGGELRSGLGGVALTDGRPTAWTPANLSSADSATALLASGSGDTAYLVAGRVVQSVTTSGQGSATDLALAPNQNIRAAAIAGESLYLTGAFATIGGRTRAGLAEVDLSVPAPAVSDWNPGATGDVRGSAIAVGGSTVYVSALAVPANQIPWGGRSRCGVAAARRDASAAVTAFDPRIGSGANCDRSPASLAVAGGLVWAAGNFSVANQQVRDGLAAIDVATDTILPWAPLGVNSAVADLAVTPDGTTVYGVGEGFELNGQPRNGAWAVAAGAAAGAAQESGDVRAWDPALSGAVTSTASAIEGGTVERVYLGGGFDSVGGDARYTRLAAVAPDTGAVVADWAPAPDALVNDLEVAGDGTLYVAGDFTTLGSTPTARRHLAALTDASDVPTAWNPELAEAAGGTVLDLAASATTVYAAGTFDGSIGGQTRRGVAALQRSDGNTVAAWNPQPDGPVATVSVGADGTVYLVGGDGFNSSKFLNLGTASRPAGLGAVAADGTVTGWAPQSSFDPAIFRWSNEVRVVAGKVIVPGSSGGRFDGVAQDGIFAFGEAAAPQILDRPVVIGTPREGSQLTCQPGAYGTDTYTLSYRWVRNGAAIDGANATTYVVAAQDRGTELACEETAANDAGSRTALSAAVRIDVNRPVRIESPEVSGDVRVGLTATCARGRWSDFPTSYRFAWLLDGAPIPGANAQDFVPVAGQEGRSLACEVIAVNAAGASDAAVSAGRAVAPGQARCTVDCEPPCTVNCSPPPPPPPCTANCSPPPPPPPPCTVDCDSPRPPAPVPSNAFTVQSARASATLLTFGLRLPGPGAVQITATARVGRRSVVVGSARTTVGRAGTTTLRLRLTAAAKRALARSSGKRLLVAVRVTFTPAGGAARTVTRSVTVKAARSASRGGGRRGR